MATLTHTSQGGGIATNHDAELIDAEQHGPDTRPIPTVFLRWAGKETTLIAARHPDHVGRSTGRAVRPKSPTAKSSERPDTYLLPWAAPLGPEPLASVESRDRSWALSERRDLIGGMPERSTYGMAVAQWPTRCSRTKKACCTDSGHAENGLSLLALQRIPLDPMDILPVSRIIRLRRCKGEPPHARWSSRHRRDRAGRAGRQ